MAYRCGSDSWMLLFKWYVVYGCFEKRNTLALYANTLLLMFFVSRLNPNNDYFTLRLSEPSTYNIRRIFPFSPLDRTEGFPSLIKTHHLMYLPIRRNWTCIFVFTSVYFGTSYPFLISYTNMKGQILLGGIWVLLLNFHFPYDPHSGAILYQCHAQMCSLDARAPWFFLNLKSDLYPKFCFMTLVFLRW